MISHDIDTLYFEYVPLAGHAEGCCRYGTGLWEVTRHTWSSYSGDKTEVTIRLVCFECGVVHFERADSDLSTSTTHSGHIGYAAKPEKVLGVWLWPGPRLWYGDDHGPSAYLITATRQRPQHPEDVLGKVGWSLGPRGGIRWSAGIGCTGQRAPLQAAGQTWPSRRPAVGWVIEHSAGAR